MKRIVGVTTFAWALFAALLYSAFTVSVMAVGGTADGPGVIATEFNDMTGRDAESDLLDPVLGPDEGDRALHLGAWHEAGFVGAGVRIGVIDSGFGRWDELQAKGVLPVVAPERRLNHCDTGFDRTVHGTATVEVLAKLAPEAELWLICIDDTVDLSEAVDELIAADVDIVNMSLGFYNTGRGDGTGKATSPDASARRAMDHGIVWVNAAGNEAELHYAKAFTDIDGDGQHEFHANDQDAEFTLEPEQSANVLLKWDAWPVTGDDFSICVGTVGGTQTCDARSSNGEREPTAFVSVFNTEQVDVIYQITVSRTEGSTVETTSPRLDLILLGGKAFEYPVASGSLGEPPSTPGVLTVGAYCASDGSRRPFSSQGTTVDGRPGVDVLAPESVSSSIYGRAVGCGTGYTGTSAAAPHVTAALALLASAMRDPDRVLLVDELLSRVAASRGFGAEPDPAAGYGRLDLGYPPDRWVNIAEIDTTFDTPDLQQAGPATGANGASFFLSDNPDRSDAHPFSRTTVRGGIRVHLDLGETVDETDRVNFFIDGMLVGVEPDPGYDLGSGDARASQPFDTTRLENGGHLLEAAVHLYDGTVNSIITSFWVDNAPDTPGPLAESRHRLVLDDDPTRLLDRSTLSEVLDVDLLVSAERSKGVDHVLFYLDARLVQYDQTAPYELGVVSAGVTVPFDADTLKPGGHVLTAFIFGDDGNVQAVSAAFTVE